MVTNQNKELRKTDMLGRRLLNKHFEKSFDSSKCTIVSQWKI